MDQILNPFDDLNPLSNYFQFKKLIMDIKDKKTLLKIGKIIEESLKERNKFI